MTLDAAAAARVIRRGRAMTFVALVGVAVICYIAFAIAPYERGQGAAFRILYWHAPAAWAMEVAFVVTGIVSILFLWLRDERLDLFAEASAEVGMVFGAVVLTTGPIWGRTIWGVYWAWDPRLTFTLLLYLVMAAYFALRSAMHDPLERGRFAAVIGIMGMLLVPFIHLTVLLFKSQHPQPVLGRAPCPPGSENCVPGLPWPLLWPLLASLGVFTLFYLGLVTMRYGIGVRRAALEEAEDA